MAHSPRGTGVRGALWSISTHRVPRQQGASEERGREFSALPVGTVGHAVPTHYEVRDLRNGSRQIPSRVLFSYQPLRKQILEAEPSSEGVVIIPFSPRGFSKVISDLRGIEAL